MGGGSKETESKSVSKDPLAGPRGKVIGESYRLTMPFVRGGPSSIPESPYAGYQPGLTENEQSLLPMVNAIVRSGGLLPFDRAAATNAFRLASVAPEAAVQSQYANLLTGMGKTNISDLINSAIGSAEKPAYARQPTDTGYASKYLADLAPKFGAGLDYAALVNLSTQLPKGIAAGLRAAQLGEQVGGASAASRHLAQIQPATALERTIEAENMRRAYEAYVTREQGYYDLINKLIALTGAPPKATVKTASGSAGTSPAVGALKGASSGASMGTSIYPGYGTAIGAGVGGLFGGLMSAFG